MADDPTRFPEGLTTALPESTLGEFILPDPSTAHVFFDDFNSFIPALWNVDGAGGTLAIDPLGITGLLVFGTDSAGDDIVLQTLKESYTLEEGKQLWAKAVFTRTFDAGDLEWTFGLQVTNTSTFDSNNGVYLQRTTDPTVYTFHTQGMTPSSLTLSATNFVSTATETVGFYYDGKQTFTAFSNSTPVGSIKITSALLSEELAVTMGTRGDPEVVNGTTALDYMYIAKER